MEQWNIEEIRDIKHYYSLREIMKDVYIERMIEQENKRRKIEALENGKNGVELISYDKLQGNTKKEKFMNLEKEIVQLHDFDNFEKEQKINLFKILDVFLVDSKKKLNNLQGRYKFNLNDYWFLRYLIEIYYMDEGKFLLKGQYNKVSEENRTLLCAGLRTLAANDNNKLEIQDVEMGINKVFNERYISLMRKLKDLNTTVEYWANVCLQSDINKSVVEEIENMIEKYDDEIMQMARQRTIYEDVDEQDLK